MAPASLFIMSRLGARIIISSVKLSGSARSSRSSAGIQPAGGGWAAPAHQQVAELSNPKRSSCSVPWIRSYTLEPR